MLEKEKEKMRYSMFYQWFLQKKHALQLGTALLIALLAFVVPTVSASAQTITANTPAEIAPQCVVFQEEVSQTESVIASLTAELNGADFSERSVIAREIEQDTTLENKELAELNACVAANPGLPPLSATLTGTFSVGTNFLGSNIHQEHTIPISIGIVFSAFRDQVTVSIPSESVPGFPVSVTESVNSTGTGTFNKTTGAMTVPTNLNFSGGILGSSSANFLFTTGNSSTSDGVISVNGTPLNLQTGQITLVATAQFSGGPLGGSDGMIIISGTISPLP
jgi:hypothetical protein